MQIVIEPAVTQKLEQLVITLVDENYFATQEAAIKYVQELYKFIYGLSTRTHRLMKNKGNGAFCAMYKPNQRTTWYVLFDVKGEKYLVRKLLNNHGQDYPELLSDLK